MTGCQSSYRDNSYCIAELHAVSIHYPDGINIKISIAIKLKPGLTQGLKKDDNQRYRVVHQSQANALSRTQDQ